MFLVYILWLPLWNFQNKYGAACDYEHVSRNRKKILLDTFGCGYTSHSGGKKWTVFLWLRVKPIPCFEQLPRSWRDLHVEPFQSLVSQVGKLPLVSTSVICMLTMKFVATWLPDQWDRRIFTRTEVEVGEISLALSPGLLEAAKDLYHNVQGIEKT